MVIGFGRDGAPMRLHKILCLGILFFVLLREDAFAQCGQTTQQSAIPPAPNGLPTPKTDNRNSEDGTVVLQLEMTHRGSVRDVEVLGNHPGKLRAAAISAAVKFANGREYYDRISQPLITVVVIFPQNGHGAPQVGQGVASGVPACVHTTGGVTSLPPSWLFNTRPVIPVLQRQTSKNWSISDTSRLRSKSQVSGF